MTKIRFPGRPHKAYYLFHNVDKIFSATNASAASSNKIQNETSHGSDYNLKIFKENDAVTINDIKKIVSNSTMSSCTMPAYVPKKIRETSKIIKEKENIADDSVQKIDAEIDFDDFVKFEVASSISSLQSSPKDVSCIIDEISTAKLHKEFDMQLLVRSLNASSSVSKKYSADKFGKKHLNSLTGVILKSSKGFLSRSKRIITSKKTLLMKKKRQVHVGLTILKKTVRKPHLTNNQRISKRVRTPSKRLLETLLDESAEAYDLNHISPPHNIYVETAQSNSKATASTKMLDKSDSSKTLKPLNNHQVVFEKMKGNKGRVGGGRKIKKNIIKLKDEKVAAEIDEEIKAMARPLETENIDSNTTSKHEVAECKEIKAIVNFADKESVFCQICLTPLLLSEVVEFSLGTSNSAALMCQSCVAFWANNAPKCRQSCDWVCLHQGLCWLDATPCRAYRLQLYLALLPDSNDSTLFLSPAPPLGVNLQRVVQPDAIKIARITRSAEWFTYLRKRVGTGPICVCAACSSRVSKLLIEKQICSTCWSAARSLQRSAQNKLDFVCLAGGAISEGLLCPLVACRSCRLRRLVELGVWKMPSHNHHSKAPCPACAFARLVKASRSQLLDEARRHRVVEWRLVQAQLVVVAAASTDNEIAPLVVSTTAAAVTDDSAVLMNFDPRRFRRLDPTVPFECDVCEAPNHADVYCVDDKTSRVCADCLIRYRKHLKQLELEKQEESERISLCTFSSLCKAPFASCDACFIANCSQQVPADSLLGETNNILLCDTPNPLLLLQVLDLAACAFAPCCVCGSCAVKGDVSFGYWIRGGEERVCEICFFFFLAQLRCASLYDLPVCFKISCAGGPDCVGCRFRTCWQRLSSKILPHLDNLSVEMRSITLETLNSLVASKQRHNEHLLALSSIDPPQQVTSEPPSAAAASKDRFLELTCLPNPPSRRKLRLKHPTVAPCAAATPDDELMTEKSATAVNSHRSPRVKNVCRPMATVSSETALSNVKLKHASRPSVASNSMSTTLCGVCQGCLRRANCEVCKNCVWSAIHLRTSSEAQRRPCLKRECKGATAAATTTMRVKLPSSTTSAPDVMYGNDPNLWETVENMGSIVRDLALATEKTAVFESDDEEYEVESIHANVEEIVTADAAWHGGIAVVTRRESAPPNEICYLCGSAGPHKMIVCCSCAEPFHWFCIEAGERPPNPSQTDTWRCRNCKVCRTCRQAGDCLSCLRCGAGHHAACLTALNYPPATIADRDAWLCPTCATCRHCQRRYCVSNSTTTAKEQERETCSWSVLSDLCAACATELSSNEICPVCRRVWCADDRQRMLRCDSCNLWVHKGCAGLTKEQYDTLIRSESDKLRGLPFTCVKCCHERLCEAEKVLGEDSDSDGNSDISCGSSHKKKKKSDPVEKSAALALGALELVDTARNEVRQNMHDFVQRLSVKENLLLGEHVFHTVDNDYDDVDADAVSQLDGTDDKILGLHEVDSGLSVSDDTDDSVYTSTATPPSGTEMSSPCKKLVEKTTTTTLSIISSSKSCESRGVFHEFIKQVEMDRYPDCVSLVACVIKRIAVCLRHPSCSSEKQAYVQLSLKLDALIQEAFPGLDLGLVENYILNTSSTRGEAAESTMGTNELYESQEKQPLPETRLQPVGFDVDSDQGIILVRRAKAYESYWMREDSRMIERFQTSKNDRRVCLLCGLCGDRATEGRLLHCGFDACVHATCALWSGEVWETELGVLRNVAEAVARGRRMSCDVCCRRGATVGCCADGCDVNMHFRCALEADAAFCTSKEVFCSDCAQICVDDEATVLPASALRITRRVTIQENLEPSSFTVDSSNLCVRIGSMFVRRLGHLADGCDQAQTVLCPQNYSVTRRFWSTRFDGRLVEYVGRIRLIEQPKEPSSSSTEAAMHSNDKKQQQQPKRAASSFIISEQSSKQAHLDDTFNSVKRQRLTEDCSSIHSLLNKKNNIPDFQIRDFNKSSQEVKARCEYPPVLHADSTTLSRKIVSKPLSNGADHLTLHQHSTQSWPSKVKSNCIPIILSRRNQSSQLQQSNISTTSFNNKEEAPPAVVSCTNAPKIEKEVGIAASKSYHFSPLNQLNSIDQQIYQRPLQKLQQTRKQVFCSTNVGGPSYVSPASANWHLTMVGSHSSLIGFNHKTVLNTSQLSSKIDNIFERVLPAAVSSIPQLDGGVDEHHRGRCARRLGRISFAKRAPSHVKGRKISLNEDAQMSRALEAAKRCRDERALLLAKTSHATATNYILQFELRCVAEDFRVKSVLRLDEPRSGATDVWNQVTARVRRLRRAMRPDTVARALVLQPKGWAAFGLSHRRVVWLLEQLRGVHRCYAYRFTYLKERARKLRTLYAPPIELNSGCARAECAAQMARLRPHETFSFLLCRANRPPALTTQLSSSSTTDHDVIPNYEDSEVDEPMLPLSMRYRELRARHALHPNRQDVAVFRSPIHARGLFALRQLLANEIIIEYTGELIRNAVCESRERRYRSQGIDCYMFRLDSDWVVDATTKGNCARFINHCCEPNCYSKIVSIDGRKRIIILASRTIWRGQELTYDYKFPKEDDKISCLCKSVNCRGSLN